MTRWQVQLASTSAAFSPHTVNLRRRPALRRRLNSKAIPIVILLSTVPICAAFLPVVCPSSKTRVPRRPRRETSVSFSRSSFTQAEVSCGSNDACVHGGSDGENIVNSAKTRRAALAKFGRSLLAGAGSLTASAALPTLLAAAPLPVAAVGEDAAQPKMYEGPPSLYLAQPMGPPRSPSSSSKPYAPPEFLLPAARVKVYVDTAAEVASELEKLQRGVGPDDGRKVNTESETNVTNAIVVLGRLLIEPPSFVRSNDPTRKTDDSGKFLSSFDTARTKQKEREDLQIEAGIAPRAFEVFELSGERRQWNRLQKEERAREATSEVRRAFNVYTTNLLFDEEKYKFKGSTEERSKMIRDDKLPSATTVIRSDLDLRDLFRNQVQTALEDAVAEYEYQTKRGRENFESVELLGLLRNAQSACDKWFSFIDVKEASFSLDVAQRESSDWYQ